jgi:hypothetical protein
MKQSKDLSPGDSVEVTYNGTIWFDATFESWVKGLGICWVKLSDGERESFSRSNVRALPGTAYIPSPVYRFKVTQADQDSSDPACDSIETD